MATFGPAHFLPAVLNQMFPGGRRCSWFPEVTGAQVSPVHGFFYPIREELPSVMLCCPLLVEVAYYRSESCL